MKLKNKLEVEETLNVGVLPNAPTNNFSVVFETAGLFQRRQVGNIINKNDNDFLPSISNAFPTSVFAFNVSTTNANPNLTVSFVNQVAGTVFSAPQSLNGTPAFRMLQDSDLSQTSLGSKQNALTNGLHTTINGNKVDVEFDVNTYVKDKSNNDRLLFGNTASTDVVIKGAVANGDFKVEDSAGGVLFRVNGSNKVPYFPQLPAPQTGATNNLAIFDSGNGLWKSNVTIGDLVTTSNIGGYIPSAQNLSLGTTTGSINISGGTGVSLASMIATNRPDANVNPYTGGGLQAFSHTNSGINYPSTYGGGISYIRLGGTFLGAFDLWTNNSNDDKVYLRTGATATTYNPYRAIATEDWGNQNYHKLAKTNAEATSAGYYTSLAAIEHNSVTGNTSFYSSGGTINGNTVTNGHVVSFGVNALYGFQLYQQASAALPLRVRNNVNGIWTNEEIAYRSWVTQQITNVGGNYITTNTTQTGLIGDKTGNGIWTLGQIRKAGQNDTQILLAGGGHRPVSDFALAGSLAGYLPLAGGTMNANAAIQWNAGTARIIHSGFDRIRFDSVSMLFGADTSGTLSAFIFRPQGSASTAGQVIIDGNGQINTSNHGNSSQWKQAFDWGNFRDYGLGLTTQVNLTSTQADSLSTTQFFRVDTATSGWLAGGFYYAGVNISTEAQRRLQIVGKTGESRYYIRRSTDNGVTWYNNELIHTNNLDTQATALGFIKSSALPTVNNGALTLTTGTGLSGSANFTANQSGNSSFDVSVASTHKLPTVAEWNALPTTNTITRLRGTATGTFVSGDLTFLNGTGIGIVQSGSNFTITNTAPNVQADWNATSGLAQILNKPTIPTVGNGQLSFTTPAGLSISGTFSANQSGNTTIPLTWQAGYQGFTTAESTKLAGIQAGATVPNNGTFTVQGTGSLTGTGSTSANASLNTSATLDLTPQTKSDIQQGVDANAVIPSILDGVMFHQVTNTNPVTIIIEKKKTIVNVDDTVLGVDLYVEDGLYDGYELAINGCNEWSANLKGNVQDKCGNQGGITFAGNSSLFWWSAEYSMWIQVI